MYGAVSVPGVRKYARHRSGDMPTPEILVARPRVNSALKYASWMMVPSHEDRNTWQKHPRVASAPEGRSNPVKGKAHVQHPELVMEINKLRSESNPTRGYLPRKMAESVQRRGKGETATYHGLRATMDPVVPKNRHRVGYGEAKRPPLRSVTASKNRIPEPRRNPTRATVGVARRFLPPRVWL